MSFDPAVFGEGFHRFVQAEHTLFGFLSPVGHAVSYVILIMAFIYGNRARRVFTIYFTANWLFLLGYWGVYGIIYWFGIGVVYLAVYLAAPLLLAAITVNWFKELLKPRIDLTIRSIHPFRFLILAVGLWGLWYPTYLYGQGFVFSARDLFFSFYGLMPCPTTMVVLSFLTLKYPDTNKTLYNLLMIYALFVGTATVLSGWLPDVPFIALGLYSFFLKVRYSIKSKQSKASPSSC